MATEIDHLTEDPVLEGQHWWCVSFLSPEGIRNCSLRGIKCRGVFKTREEADTHAEKLRNDDPLFDVFVGEVGKWCPWDPEPSESTEQRYYEKELQDLMKGYKDNREKAKVAEQERRKELKKKPNKQDDTKARLKALIAEKKREKELADGGEANVEETEVNVKLNDNMKRIQELHEKLSQKKD